MNKPLNLLLVGSSALAVSTALFLLGNYHSKKADEYAPKVEAVDRFKDKIDTISNSPSTYYTNIRIVDQEYCEATSTNNFPRALEDHDRYKNRAINFIGAGYVAATFGAISLGVEALVRIRKKKANKLEQKVTTPKAQ